MSKLVIANIDVPSQLAKACQLIFDEATFFLGLDAIKDKHVLLYFESMKGKQQAILGATDDELKNGFLRVVISKNTDRMRAAEVFAHELVHVAQQFHNTMRVQGDKVYWNGDTYDRRTLEDVITKGVGNGDRTLHKQYKNFPWEVEAETLSAKIMLKIKPQIERILARNDADTDKEMMREAA